MNDSIALLNLLNGKEVNSGQNKFNKEALFIWSAFSNLFEFVSKNCCKHQ